MRRRTLGALLVLSAALYAGCGGAGRDVMNKGTVEEGAASAKIGLASGTTDMTKTMQNKPQGTAPSAPAAPLAPLAPGKKK